MKHDWAGYPTKERFRKSPEHVELPERYKVTSCTVVPILKPIDYAVKTKKNPLEKALTDQELLILTAYCWGKLHVRAQPSTSSMENAGGGFGSRALIDDEAQIFGNWARYIEKNLSEDTIRVLAHMQASLAMDHGLTEQDIGKLITNSKDRRRILGNFEGYSRCAAQQILHFDKIFFSEAGVGGVYLAKRIEAKRMK